LRLRFSKDGPQIGQPAPHSYTDNYASHRCPAAGIWQLETEVQMADHVHAGRGSSKWLIIGIGFAAIAGFLILQGHGNHLLAYSPLLILLACPLLHMAMHRGHGSHGAHRQPQAADESPQQREA
jgi:hypothetical protein